MTGDSLRCGLVGYGRVAERYYHRALARSRSATLAAVADPLVERRDKVVSNGSACPTYESAEQLMRDPSVDAVIVTSPPDTHVSVVSKAVDVALPVLVEKPLAPTASEAVALTERVRSSGAYVQMGFNRRFWEPVQRLRRIIQQSQGPAASCVEMSFSSDVERWNAISGSPEALVDIGCHQLDLLRFLFAAEIRSISASRDGLGGLWMRVRLIDGLEAVCRINEHGPSREEITVAEGGRRYRIHGGSDLIYPESGKGRWFFDAASAASRRLRGRLPALIESFDRQLEWFAESVLSGRRPTPDIGDGLCAAMAVDAARVSAERDGEEVWLPA